MERRRRGGRVGGREKGGEGGREEGREGWKIYTLNCERGRQRARKDRRRVHKDGAAIAGGSDHKLPQHP